MLRVRALDAGAYEPVVPGDGLLHPVVIAAIAALVVNDHVLKQVWPGTITGKLSDIAGLIFFPLLLQAAWEVWSAIVGKRAVANQRLALAAIAMTAIVFGLVKSVPLATDAYSWVVGLLQWLVAAGPAFVMSGRLGELQLVRVVTDPTDLAVLPVLALPFVLAKARARVAEARR